MSPSGQPVPDAVELMDSSTADLPDMLARGQVRVLVEPNRTNFTMAQDGSFQGLEYDLAKLLEQSLNRDRKKGQTKIKVIFVPVRFEDMADGQAILTGNFRVDPAVPAGIDHRCIRARADEV